MRNEATTQGDSTSAVVDAPSNSFRARPATWLAMIALPTAICAVAIMIGTHKFHLGPAAIVLMPILWTVLIAGFVGVQKWKPIGGRGRAVSTHLLDVAIVFFLAGLGTQIGPSLTKFTNIGPAILLQEVGHVLGTVILALPVAVALGLGRTAIGATWSIDRESYLAFAIQRFGVRSPEYRGVFAVWVLGSIFGAVFISLLAGLLGGLDFFDPRALALGLGLGSASMMLGGVGALSILYPERAGEIMALAALSNLVTNIVGFYAGVFIALPMCQKLYKMWSRIFGRDDLGRRVRRGALVGATSGARAGSDSGRPGRTAIGPDAASGIDAVDVTAIEADPTVVRTPKTWLIAFAATGVAGVLLNALGTGSTRPLDIVGVLILLAFTAIALVLAKLIPAVPSTIWVLALATIASATFMPIGPFVASAAQNINVLFAGLPMIALIGLSLGRDVKALRSLSWKIVIVALLTFTASFVAAAVIAQVAFHF
ncbi:DUF3100 domain-containing protein [Pseudarthrobacter sp. H3Y2-7]|uniref:DUF3100 domain-containing protein n=1 Tax=Pseudarthrobacter naphthalenicus TaxID=3031328 RepID=UPI0023AF79FF|nr:DUF3100 domain-containing protein [Pseudarthrobacter sp. H3Y2-7]MDE8667728.1 DUF3100 domain-containing protein [Pseudarthrobacter sp. H3Y2-7]